MTTDKNEYSPITPFGKSLPANAASLLFGAVVKVRNALYDSLPFLKYQAARPVISVGGLRAGGTGKTPVALMIGEYLLSKGQTPVFLSRGYRRKAHGLRIVKPDETVSWEEIGDEPFLLHQRLPQSWLGIDADRCRAASRLSALLPGRAVFVLDDGFQHRRLRRDLDIVCLHDTLADDRLLPAGWLREPAAALSRAHAALIIGPTDRTDAMETLRSTLAQSFPRLFIAVLFQEPGPWMNAAAGSTASVPPLKNPLLVCGIARPERFIAMVRKQGILPRAELTFPDHHRYGTDDFSEYRELYLNGIVTTEKDAVRLAPLAIMPAEQLWYCGTVLRFADQREGETFYSLIDTGVIPREKRT
ncbi:MAG: tetraacyldisaccharide 4'-kinase [Chitinispirillaceae bacterium]|nr:tetraacyldisaccharide 4'-kinase [Chitinispirillaceae bacterium]